MEYTQIIRIIIFNLIPRIILTLSIFYYDKSRGIEKKKTSYVLAFIFTTLYIIARLIRKKGTCPASQNNTYKNRSIVLLIIYILLIIGSHVTTYVRVINTDHYFDMYGNGYNKWYQVVYYTEDGTGYVMDIDEHCFVEVDNPEHRIEERGCFLDKNGYLVYIDPQTLDYDESVSRDDPFRFYDSENNYYAFPNSACWNAEGELVDSDTVYTVKNDFIEKLKPYIDKLIEKQQSQQYQY